MEQRARTDGPGWTDGWWWSRDGLRLHYRDHAGADDRLPVLCIPGLTRNARDFEPFVRQVAGRRRVVTVELRGRGESAYAKDPMTYVPLTYLQDLEALLEALGWARFVAVGTSLGGILTMLLASTGRERLAGVVLNDIGPDIDPRGLARIRTYVGKPAAYPTWLHAARALAEGNRTVYPGYDLPEWLAMAKRLCRLTPAGRIVYDYDMRIAEPMRLPQAETAFDLWPAADALKGVPGLVVRGALSDLLTEATATALAERVGFAVATVPDTGHAPVLDEPVAAAAVARLLEHAD